MGFRSVEQKQETDTFLVVLILPEEEPEVWPEEKQLWPEEEQLWPEGEQLWPCPNRRRDELLPSDVFLKSKIFLTKIYLS